MESREAPNLETAEEESEKPGTFAEEEPANEELRTDENAGPAVENSETLKLVLEDTVAEVLDDTVVEKDDTVDEEKKGVEEVDSLKLVLEPDTPIEEEEEIILSSQVVSRTTMTVKSSAQERLERLRKKFGDIAGLEKSMNITPRVAEGADDELVFCEKSEEKLSHGAEKLFQKFITHAFAKGRKVDEEEEERTVENVTIVTKKKAEDGTEVLCQEVIQYQGDEKKSKKKEAPLAGAKFVSMKEKLKAQMLERRLEVRKKRVVEMKMNENELCDDLPDEELEDDEDYNYNDEEEYMGEDEEEEEEESEPEENDVDVDMRE